MTRLGGTAVTLTASTDVTVITTSAATMSAIRILIMNLDTVSHDYPIKLGSTQVGIVKGVPAGEQGNWGPHHVAASTAVKVTAPATTTTASQAVVTGEDDL